MGDDSADLIGVIKDWVLILVMAATTWVLFFEIIHPALLGLSPAFAFNPDGYIGRAPDSLAQVALFATIPLVFVGAFLLRTLIYEGTDEFIDDFWVIYSIIILIPLGIAVAIIKKLYKFFVLSALSMVKSNTFPKFDISRWKSDSRQDKYQSDDL